MSATNWLRRASGLYMPGFAGISKFGLGCTCCGESCTACDGSVPATATLTFTGFSNAGCTNCAGYNTSFVMDQETLCYHGTAIYVGWTNVDCVVYQIDSGVPCTATAILIEFAWDAANSRRAITVWVYTTGATIEFKKVETSVSSPFSCSQAALDIPFSYNSAPPFGTHLCTTTSATCTLDI